MSLQTCAPAPALELRAEAPADAPAVEALLDHAFGPGRFVKSSERVREAAEFAPELSVVASEAGRLLGVVRMWRAAVGGQPVVFLGPLAVEADERRAGLGGVLVERACALAEAAGEPAVLLVGDMPYFGRFGFEVAQGVEMPGPVDPRRVLVRKFADAAVAGPVGPG
jgi:predicted N-acetyltransferase YhbS